LTVVNQAMASNVCNQPGDGGKCNPGRPSFLFHQDQVGLPSLDGQVTARSIAASF